MTNHEKQPLHVAFNITGGYASLCAITLYSLCASNAERAVVAHILATEMTDEGQRVIARVAEKFAVTLHYYDASTAVAPLAKVYANKRYHISVNYRIFVANLLPAEVERVLYLDCDTMVRGDVSAFYDQPLPQDLAAVVVRDEPIYFPGKHPRRVQHALGADYFNSGVMLINLDYWRANAVAEQCVANYSQAPTDYPFPDQDLLNEVLQGHVRHASPRWNCLSYFYTHQFYQKPGISPIDYALLRSAVIVHFINRNKPWTARCTHPFRTEYLALCKAAVGEAWIRQHRTLGYYLFRPIYRLLIALGLKKSYITLD